MITNLATDKTNPSTDSLKISGLQKMLTLLIRTDLLKGINIKNSIESMLLLLFFLCQVHFRLLFC